MSSSAEPFPAKKMLKLTVRVRGRDAHEGKPIVDLLLDLYNSAFRNATSPLRAFLFERIRVACHGHQSGHPTVI